MFFHFIFVFLILLHNMRVSNDKLLIVSKLRLLVCHLAIHKRANLVETGPLLQQLVFRK